MSDEDLVKMGFVKNALDYSVLNTPIRFEIGVNMFDITYPEAGVHTAGKTIADLVERAFWIGRDLGHREGILAQSVRIRNLLGLD